MMNRLQILGRASLLFSIFALHSFADDRYIVRAHPSVIDRVAKQHNLKIEGRIGPEGVYLVRLPNGVSPDSLVEDAAIQAVEKNSVVSLPEVSGYSNQGKRRIPHVTGGAVTVSMAGAPFSAYTNQKPNSIIRLQQAQKRVGYGNGSIKVAVIDTWIDANHAVLQGVVDPVLDFVNGKGGTAYTSQETTPFVDQETTPFVDGIGSIVVVQQETTPFVDQETTPFVDQETTPFVDGKAWGHGTMVAGIIHLVAPNVRILPLRAFKGDGSALLSDVIAAINYAVSHGAQVINMSFSTPDAPSQALIDAIAAAQNAGVICIASVANHNSSASVYPASVNPVIGVAATNNDSERAWFSNFGPEVDIAAPGVDIWTTYPTQQSTGVNTRYAAVSGTSFSSAYVTGSVALMRSASPGLTAAQALGDLKSGADKVKSPELNAGELDVFKSVK